MPWYDSENDVIELVCVIDRSGSMSSLQKEAIEGFNDLIDEQRKLSGDAFVTLVLFDDEYDMRYEGKSINDVEPLTAKTFVPRGYTALLDSIGKTVGKVKERIFAMDESDQPGKVLFCIITDGQENHSQEFKKDAITKIIADCKDEYTWDFIFLSADMEAVGDARSYGVLAGMSVGVDYSSGGMKKAFAVTNLSASAYRSATKSEIKSGITNSLVQEASIAYDEENQEE